MGFLDVLSDMFSKTASTVERGVERNVDNYASGYEYGSKKASHMSNEELRSSLKRAKESGVSDWSSAGKVRAMADEYNNRK